ncbi:MAG: hypothetical protein KAJ16_11205 [Calditrichia bacterium]|nr:hypothetical protein [Calditrichia bacterium]MCK5454924.1 hypothetical protein [Calditrichia bacterium]NOQ97654.1 hypothetical protein [Calditrichia bacterium]
MKEITREQAEELFQLSKVLKKEIIQTKTELKLQFSLSNQQALHVIYNVKNHNQTFFMDQPAPTKAK